MKSVLKVYSFILIISILIFSCDNPQTVDEDITSEDLSNLEIPENTQGLVTFISGDAEYLNNGEWEILFIGDLVDSGSTLKVFQGSFCEIQFGDRAIVKLEENTEIILESVLFETENTDIAINIITGSLLCKVDKLLGNESFSVKTNSSVCGEFRNSPCCKRGKSGSSSGNCGYRQSYNKAGNSRYFRRK